MATKEQLASYRDTVERLNKARASGDPDQIKAAEKLLAMHEQYLNGGKVGTNKHDLAFRGVIEKMADEVAQVGVVLKSLDERKEQFPAEYYAKERARLMAGAQQGDRAVRQAFQSYVAEAASEARKLRARAEADRDPASRAAEATERAALLAGSANVADLLAQASLMVEAERPQRAAFLLSVAKERGASQIQTHALSQQVEASLDTAVPQRAEARAIEDALESNFRTFTGARFKVLADAGLGIAANGDAGSGGLSEVAAANASRKLASFLTGGTDIHDAPTDPVGGGA
jgi:hypothetical protein